MQESFGQRFQRLRKQAGLTQEEVATKLNITAQAVSKWENDVSAPDISVLVELSEILQVSLDELLGKAPAVRLVPNDMRKSIDTMFLKLRVISDSDKVNINLPLAVARTLIKADIPINVGQNGKNVMSSIDFDQVFALVEQGVIGKILEVEETEGNTKVEIWVE